MLAWTSSKHCEPGQSIATLSLPSLDFHRLWRGALVLCCVFLTTCSAPGYVDTVLFVVTYNREHGEVTAEPAVEIIRGRLGEPQASGEFVKTYLTNRIYPLYQQGHLIGRLQVEGLMPAGCSALQTAAQVQITGPLLTTAFNHEGSTFLLASASLLPAPAAPLAQLGADDRDLLRRAGLAQLRELGVSETTLRAAVLTDAARFTLDGRPVLAGTVSVLADAVATPGASAFVMLERAESGWHTAYLSRNRFRDIYGNDFDGQVFREAVDLDRDGVPELLLERIGNETYQYQILKHEGGAWRVLYTGGGGGC
jgi:hypothetical protein